MLKSMYLSDCTVQRLRRVQELLDYLHAEAAPQARVVPSSPQPRDSIIVLPGSFNPPTIAHLALLKQAQQFAPQQNEPMYLYTAMSRLTVDKEIVERPTQLDRIMLLSQLLHTHFPHAGILLFNHGLYVEQAEAIRHSFPRVKRLLFLIGFDKIVQIFDPHYYNDRDTALADLFHLAELLVVPRGNGGEHELTTLLHQPQNEPFAHYIHTLPFDATYRNISSTHIRQGKSASSQDVLPEVRRFMRETHAYASPIQRRDGSVLDYYAQRVKYLNALLKA